tara:strand:+ start:483 stop:1109 length:627 start_codon:yes stop_codon:yes gene_type:complete
MAEKKALIAINSDKITYADSRLRNIIDSHIGYTDGIGAVWALRQKGVQNVIKISGSELWLAFIKKYYSEKSVYLIGADSTTIQEVVEKLHREFVGINIVGYRDGYLKDSAEQTLLLQDISKVRPDIIFVAMGSPRQEYLMEDIYRIYPTLMLGLGGSFDIYAGRKRRAPELIIKMNLEFLYRYIFSGVKLKRIIVDFRFFVLLISRKL